MLFLVLLELSFFDQETNVDWHLEETFVKLSMITTYKLQFQKTKTSKTEIEDSVNLLYLY